MGKGFFSKRPEHDASEQTSYGLGRTEEGKGQGPSPEHVTPSFLLDEEETMSPSFILDERPADQRDPLYYAEKAELSRKEARPEGERRAAKERESGTAAEDAEAKAKAAFEAENAREAEAEAEAEQARRSRHFEDERSSELADASPEAKLEAEARERAERTHKILADTEKAGASLQRQRASEGEIRQDPMDFDEYQSLREGNKQMKKQGQHENEMSQTEKPYVESPHAKPLSKEAEERLVEKEEKKDEKKDGVKAKIRRTGESISRAWRIAGITIMVILLVFAIIGVISTVGFFKNRGRLNTPVKAGDRLVKVLEENDFEAYRKLLASPEVSANDKPLFESLRSSLDNEKETLVSNFILIRLENGKQFLCSIFYDEGRKEYVFRSVQEVPLSMQNIFVSK